MRDIKFRFWLKNDESMCSWECAISALSDTSYFFTSDEVEPMQLTGLKDKNGVDIYEGDILSFKWLHQDDSIYIDDELIYGQVQFVSGKFIVRHDGSAFDVSGINQVTFERFWRETYNSAKTDYFKMIGFEVVGNIYENSDLLD